MPWVPMRYSLQGVYKEFGSRTTFTAAEKGWRVSAANEVRTRAVDLDTRSIPLVTLKYDVFRAEAAHMYGTSGGREDGVGLFMGEHGAMGWVAGGCHDGDMSTAALTAAIYHLWGVSPRCSKDSAYANATRHHAHAPYMHL